MDSYASIHVHGENGGRFNRYDHGASSRHSDFYHCGSIPSQCWQCQHYTDPGEISLIGPICAQSLQFVPKRPICACPTTYDTFTYCGVSGESFGYYQKAILSWLNICTTCNMTSTSSRRLTTACLFVFLKSGLKRVKSCGNESTIDLDTLDHVPRNDTNINPNSTKRLLLPTATYSDNNHFVRFDWYKETIESLISLARPPERVVGLGRVWGCMRTMKVIW